MTFRQDALTPGDELLAELLENQDAWQRAHMQITSRKRGQIMVPAPVRVERPGQTEPERKANVMSIAEFARANKTHVRGGGAE